MSARGLHAGAAPPTRARPLLGAEILPNVDGLLDALAERVADIVVERLAGQDEAPSPWLDVDEAAAYIRAEGKNPRQRIYDLVNEDRLRCAKEGSRSLFRREWLDECIADEGS